MLETVFKIATVSFCFISICVNNCNYFVKAIVKLVILWYNATNFVI